MVAWKSTFPSIGGCTVNQAKHRGLKRRAAYGISVSKQAQSCLWHFWHTASSHSPHVSGFSAIRQLSYIVFFERLISSRDCTKLCTRCTWLSRWAPSSCSRLCLTFIVVSSFISKSLACAGNHLPISADALTIRWSRISNVLPLS